MDQLKVKLAQAALKYIEDDMIIGVGTGSTAAYLIDALATIKGRVEACVASSKATEARLREVGLPVVDLNSVRELPIYIDSADEVNERGEMIKGGGGALTREKIVSTVARRFICIAEVRKKVSLLGTFPVAVEVLPIARSFVAREIVKLGGSPIYRDGFVTDNGNIILDVYQLDLTAPFVVEEAINRIPGVVENGIFSIRRADTVLIATDNGVAELLS